MSKIESISENPNDQASSDISKEQAGWFQNVIRDRGMFGNVLSFPKDKFPWHATLLLMALAYYLSFWVRLEWIDFAQASYENEQGETVYFHPDMVKDGVALPNTHDSFYFGSILQKAHFEMHQDNNLIPSALNSGMITMLPYWLLQLFPSLTIEVLLLWLPVYIAGIVCIPIVLIGRLYGSNIWGFFAACLAGVTHSYYNRTLAGYYDTDMFSITVPAFALYFLLSASRRRSLHYALAAALTLYLYRFFYASGQAITGALTLSYIGYRVGLVALDYFVFHQKKWREAISSSSATFTFKSIMLVAFAAYAESWSYGSNIERSPGWFFAGLLILITLFFILGKVGVIKKKSEETDKNISNGGLDEQWGNRREDSSRPKLSIFTLPPFLLPLICLLFTAFAILGGDVKDKIFAKLDRYVSAGEGVSLTSQNKEKGYSLSYLDVFSTVREASGIPKEVVRNRILADSPSCSCPRCLPAKDKDDAFIIPTAIFGLLGVILIILRYWEFCMAIPFLAIAYYCFEGAVGLRFTVHVGNIAALGVTFLILVILWSILFSPIAGMLSKFNSPSALDSKAQGKFQKFPTYIINFLYWSVCVFIVVGLVRPNIQHAQNYHSHVVYPTKTIDVLTKLNEASNPDDFVVTWWDYGSGCWFYGGARTFTSPAHQTFDNYLTSEILRSRNSKRAVNLARLKTDTYVDMQEKIKQGKPTYSTAVQAIFNDGKPDLEFYQGILHDLETGTYPLPPQSRDIFLFLPYEILKIFPTILSFSSRNLYFSDGQAAQNSSNREPPMKILRNGRVEGYSFNFDEGFRFDKQGNLRVEGEQSGIVSYSQLWSTSGNTGDFAKLVQSVNIDGFNILSKPDPRSGRALLLVKNTKELIILSSTVFNSTFAKRFLLDKFDAEAFSHPKFENGVNPVRQPFMTQADWVTSMPDGVSLNMRGGYKVEANLKTYKAKVPGVQEAVPFAFHRRMHDSKTGKLIKMPSQKLGTPRFHLIQTNLPIFAGGRRYEVPSGGRTVEEVARSTGVPQMMLAQHLELKVEDVITAGEEIEIPARGYQMSQAWFFMDQETFESVLVQGFLMEDLPADYFQKVYSTPWGKVYKIVN